MQNLKPALKRSKLLESDASKLLEKDERKLLETRAYYISSILLLQQALSVLYYCNRQRSSASSSIRSPSPIPTLLS